MKDTIKLKQTKIKTLSIYINFTKQISLLNLPIVLGLENLRLRDGIHGIAQGAVFIVNVQVLLVNNGSRGDTSVSHLPILLTWNKKSNIKISFTWKTYATLKYMNTF